MLSPLRLSAEAPQADGGGACLLPRPASTRGTYTGACALASRIPTSWQSSGMGVEGEAEGSHVSRKGGW